MIYHIAITFQPWGVFIGFIQSERPLEGLWIPMSMLNIWRIPLLFFVSGMGVGFAMRKRNLKELLTERTRRILLPFVFGVIFIVPVHIFLWQKYYNQDPQFRLHPGHLWFLGNIFCYVLILGPLFYVLKKKENSRLVRGMKQLFSHPAGLLIVPGAFALEAMLIRPEIYTLYAMTLHGFIMGMLAFLFGFIVILSGDPFRHVVIKWRWFTLILALALFMIRWRVFDLRGPNYLLAGESCTWVFSVFGFSALYLNRPGKALTYLSRAAYPIYIVHMIFLYLGASLIIPLDIPVIAEFILVLLFTGAGSFGLYELVIRRVNFLRPLFGLKTRQKAKDHKPYSCSFSDRIRSENYSCSRVDK